MIEDRLNNSLYYTGYRRINSNAQGIYLFYQADEKELTIIAIIHAAAGNEFTQEQYEHILEQLKTSLRKDYSQRMNLLSLIFTENPDMAKYLAVNAKQDHHWLIDTNTNRLILYETENEGFHGLHTRIEQLLEEERYQSSNETYPFDNNYNNGRYYQSERTGRNQNIRYVLMPVTMSIIAVNIISYLIIHYTPLFGGEQLMFEKGALSWYYIKTGQEFYRLLTSMFMHADWSHLINNMIVLLFIGGQLEKAVGRIKYLLVYFGAGALAGTTSFSYNMWKEYSNVANDGITFSIGASGAIFGIVGAILYIVIINRGRLREISMQQMIIFIILSLYNGVANSSIDQAAHVGGFIAGIILAVILYRRPRKSIEN